MICECSNNEFYASQLVIRRETIVVDAGREYKQDGSNEFHHPDEDSCISCETPKGPFFCRKCGKEYAEWQEAV